MDKRLYYTNTYNKKFFVYFILLSLIFFCVSCVASQSQSSYIQNIEKRKQSRESKELNRKIIEESISFNARDYLIGPGDLLGIKVLETEDLFTEARVNPDNDITFPLLGEVEVGGLTSQEVEDKITHLLTKKYMHDPHVVVSIEEYRSKRVAVIGSVNKPGTYEILGSGNLLYALALAEGLNEDAGRVAYVTRRGKDGNDNSVVIDLDELLDEGNVGLNIPIRMGDTVYIPEAGLFYVNGAVNKPGSYHLEEDMTISKAIATAGGFNNVAKDSDVRLVRIVKGVPEITVVDVDEIHKGNEQDIALIDEDVIVVGSSAFKSFFSRIKPGLFFPPFSVGIQ
ncbi:SLBB domain-containing protein [Desulfobacterota bacterium AH_259_B03_O07]|nr:SLBB domain-containing protein [Desulfobacterota bacterium AH_259_B03_O07]